MTQAYIENQDLENFINKAVESTCIYSTPLIHRCSNVMESEIGSGTFVIIGNTKGILTNAHVAKIFEGLSYFSVPDPDVNEKLHNFPFTLSIKLPAMPQFPDVDMAFLILDARAYDNVDKIGKQFWNLDQFRMENKDPFFNNENDSVYLIHGYVDKGKRLIDGGNAVSRKILLYPNAGPYIVAPDLNNIESGTCTYEELRNGTFKVDNITCPINTKDKMPNDFSGMSGGALWQIIFDPHDNVQKVILRGIATIFKRNTETNKVESLECRGPITLYKSFYPFCLGAIYAHSLRKMSL